MLSENIKCPEQANPQRQTGDQWLARTKGKKDLGITANELGVTLGGMKTFWN